MRIVYWRTPPPKQEETGICCWECHETHPCMMEFNKITFCFSCLEKAVKLFEDESLADWAFTFREKPDPKYYLDLEDWNNLPDHFGQGMFGK